MSAQTLIIFVQNRMPKTPKNTQQCIKMMKISQMSVLCVLDAKIPKSDEKHIKFAQLAVSVPQVSKVVIFSPW